MKLLITKNKTTMPSLGYAQTEPEVKKETMLSSFHNQFIQENNRQSHVIHNIADRVHEILNKRAPQQPTSDGGKEAPLGDWATRFQKEMNILKNNNDILEQILYHLNEIV